MARVEGLDTRHVTAAVGVPVKKQGNVNMALLGVFREQINALGKAAAFEARLRSEADLTTLGRYEETSEDHRRVGNRRQWGTVASGAARALLSGQGELAANAAGMLVDGASQMSTRNLDAKIAGTDPGRVEAARAEAEVKRSTVSSTERLIEATSQAAQQALQRWAASAA